MDDAVRGSEGKRRDAERPVIRRSEPEILADMKAKVGDLNEAFRSLYTELDKAIVDDLWRRFSEHERIQVEFTRHIAEVEMSALREELRQSQARVGGLEQFAKDVSESPYVAERIVLRALDVLAESRRSS